MKKLIFPSLQSINFKLKKMWIGLTICLATFSLPVRVLADDEASYDTTSNSISFGLYSSAYETKYTSIVYLTSWTKILLTMGVAVFTFRIILEAIRGYIDGSPIDNITRKMIRKLTAAILMYLAGGGLLTWIATFFSL